MREKPHWISRLEQDIEQNPVKKYSQIGEEGVILAICEHLRIEKGTFIDFGAGDGSMSNVRLLHEMGWTGMGYEGKEFKTEFEWLRPGTWITRIEETDEFGENAVKLYVDAIPDEIFNSEKYTDEHGHDFDFMSLDLDGNDYWVLKNLMENNCHPSIICAEINTSIQQHTPQAIEYNESHTFGNDNYYGMNGPAFCQLVEANGYVCVLNQQGLNAWAIRADLLPDDCKGYRPEFTRKNDWPEAKNGKKWVSI